MKSRGLKPYVQPPEERLAEVDRIILETAKRGSELIMMGAPTPDVDAEVNFMRHLYQRRDLILNEMKRVGLTEKDAYDHLRAKQEVMA